MQRTDWLEGDKMGARDQNALKKNQEITRTNSRKFWMFD